MLLPAIHFEGNCNEAISLYKEVLGAEVQAIAYFKDRPADSGMEETLPDDFVMHSEVKISDVVLSMTDGGEKRPTGDNFSFIIIKENKEEVTDIYNGLLEGGKEIIALAPVFWASTYGLVEDKFGISWQVMTRE